MKVIFLDFDGVLNSDRYIKRYNDEVDAGICEAVLVPLDLTRVELLKEIVDKTGAKIVLSTSWREDWSNVPGECKPNGHYINELFASYGMEVYDKTPVMGYNMRMQEIQLWLDEHPDIENYVVLDDAIMRAPFLEKHYIQTYASKKGLDEKAVVEAVRILNQGR